MSDVLPTCVPANPRGVIVRSGVPWVPFYCANCGAFGGRGTTTDMDFAFYLCCPCAETYGHIAGTMAIPDEVYWQKCKDAQLERYGRELTAVEIDAELANPDSMLSKLARDARG